MLLQRVRVTGSALLQAFSLPGFHASKDALVTYQYDMKFSSDSRSELFTGQISAAESAVLTALSITTLTLQ